jgi:hypothetical protein
MTVDVVGVIIEMSNIVAVKLKTGETKDRLNITIADDTNHSVPITAWGDTCNLLVGNV